MSQHQAFRRVPVPQQVAQSLKVITLPAPTRGIVQAENEAFMQPGAAIVMDNWAPTQRGCKLRGGYIRWCDLHYSPAGFAQAWDQGRWDSAAWDQVITPPLSDPVRKPIISGFEYISRNMQSMYAGQETELYDVTASLPVLIKGGQASGNYSTAQLANEGGDWMIVVNDAGDNPLRFNGTTWELETPFADNPIMDIPAGGLTYVWKYRNRLFFIETNSMNAWYLPLNAVGGALELIPLSGSASKGGKLLFGAVWSVGVGDGLDDKCCFVTDRGEVLVFTGSNPADAANWRQEGRYVISPPLGMNAHVSVGGDLLIATVDGIVPISQAVQKESGQLELAMITRNIKPLWREEVAAKRGNPWTIKKWDEYGGIFVATPGDPVGKRHCLVVNNATGAWCRFLGYDATCFMLIRGNLYFGTQDGIVMQAERTGYDDGKPYVATLVGGWETFQTQSGQAVWHQARVIYTSSFQQIFWPQVAATTDYQIDIPPPPVAPPDPGIEDVWDQGLWDQALWDQPSVARPPHRNTMWVSIGRTGFSHAPIVQVTVAQKARPNVELVAIAATYERAGVNV